MSRVNMGNGFGFNQAPNQLNFTSSSKEEPLTRGGHATEYKEYGQPIGAGLGNSDGTVQ